MNWSTNTIKEIAPAAELTSDEKIDQWQLQRRWTHEKSNSAMAKKAVYRNVDFFRWTSEEWTSYAWGEEAVDQQQQKLHRCNVVMFCCCCCWKDPFSMAKKIERALALWRAGLQFLNGVGCKSKFRSNFFLKKYFASYYDFAGRAVVCWRRRSGVQGDFWQDQKQGEHFVRCGTRILVLFLNFNHDLSK